MALGLIATIGFFLSLVHAFIRKKKSAFEKTCIGAFIMGTNGLAGILAGLEMLPSRWSMLVIIPIWNVLMGIVLLYQLGLNKFTVSDQESWWFDVFVASVTLLIVFAITDFGFHLSWAISFSICVFYSSTVFFLVTRALNFLRLRFFAET